ncbi:hypothetical protein RHSIM_Rhsim10G0142600 [Rhododendron simsii]|uniref:Uncharacterized protein n=1 Tax=Rhododendron simsii TaxID=118357 RepID=A0A834GBG1_RHOSS|nr:hypothetical protein RHSIM_Rhsim10G0142600 [Rhododendron simsii]
MAFVHILIFLLQKYFVDEKSNKNCFVLFARELLIVHGENPKHWRWIKDKDTRWDQVGTNCGKIGLRRSTRASRAKREEGGNLSVAELPEESMEDGGVVWRHLGGTHGGEVVGSRRIIQALDWLVQQRTASHRGQESLISSGEDIEVAEVLEVCWLEVGGAIRTINLSPGTLYEIVFVLMKFESDIKFNLDLTIKPQHSKALMRSESLEERPLEEWFEVLVGEFMFTTQYVGSLEFSLGQHDWQWKCGLVVKCAIIRPKN